MTIEKDNKPSVYKVTRNIIFELSESLGTSSSRAALANLRNSIGRDISSSIDAWKLMIERTPEELLSTNGKVNYQERAIMSTLQLYALHQQGKPTSVNTFNDGEGEKYKTNIGKSFSILRAGDNSVAVDRRFNAMVTSSSFEELFEHLRHLITLLKSKSDSKVNYAQLSNDLYWFQLGSSDRIKFRWAQGYYGSSKVNNKKGEN